MFILYRALSLNLKQQQTPFSGSSVCENEVAVSKASLPTDRRQNQRRVLVFQKIVVSARHHHEN